MKIFNVQSNPYFGQQLAVPFDTKGRQLVCNGLPRLNRLDCDIVSFGSEERPTQVTIATLKSISDLPCIYCGEPMLSIPDRNKLVQEGKDATGYKLASLLMENEKYLRRFKKDIARVIIDKAISSPQDNIQQILIKLEPDYIYDLERKQIDVLRNLKDKYYDAFKSKEERKAFQLFLYETSQWIHYERGTSKGVMPFKIKTFYNELESILSLPIFRDRELVKNILADAHKMPQSTESESAFIVKYAKRSPREILEMLFFEPLITAEHIKPQVDGGRNENMKNIAMACSYCNNARRGHIPMDVFVEKNPEVEKNLKKHLNKLREEGKKNRPLKHILDDSNNKEKQINQYIREIAKTFMWESKGRLNLREYVNQ